MEKTKKKKGNNTKQHSSTFQPKPEKTLTDLLRWWR